MKKTILFFLTFARFLGHGQIGVNAKTKLETIPKGIKMIKFGVDSSLNDIQVAKNSPTLSGLMEQGQPAFKAILLYAHADTTAIVAVPDGVSGNGLRVVIIGDSCRIYHRATDGTIIIPTTCSLSLSREPPFSESETIWGNVGFEGGAGNGIQLMIYGRFHIPAKK